MMQVVSEISAVWRDGPSATAQRKCGKPSGREIKMTDREKVLNFLERRGAAPTLQICALTKLTSDEVIDVLIQLHREGRIKIAGNTGDIRDQIIVLKSPQPSISTVIYWIVILILAVVAIWLGRKT
jgi:hypothetical protein